MKKFLSAIFVSGAIVPLIFSLIFFAGYFFKWNFLLEYFWFAPYPLIAAIVLFLIGIIWAFRYWKKTNK